VTFFLGNDFRQIAYVSILTTPTIAALDNNSCLSSSGESLKKKIYSTNLYPGWNSTEIVLTPEEKSRLWTLAFVRLYDIYGQCLGSSVAEVLTLSDGSPPGMELTPEIVMPAGAHPFLGLSVIEQPAVAPLVDVQNFLGKIRGLVTCFTINSSPFVSREPPGLSQARSTCHADAHTFPDTAQTTFLNIGNVPANAFIDVVVFATLTDTSGSANVELMKASNVHSVPDFIHP
jgi:hypothetical protein